MNHPYIRCSQAGGLSHRCTENATHRVAFSGVVSWVAGALCQRHAAVTQAEYDRAMPQVQLSVVPIDAETFTWADDHERDAAWARFRSVTPFDPTEADPATGECWQYMGSGLYGGGWWHDFRHRSFHGERKVVRLAATEGWAPEPAPALV